MATCRSCEAVAHGRMSLMGDSRSWQDVLHGGGRCCQCGHQLQVVAHDRRLLMTTVADGNPANIDPILY